MRRWTCFAALWAATLSAQQDRDPDALLTRIQTRVRENLARLPDYVCVQTVERTHRATPREEFKLQDTLRLEVALIGNQERFAWVDARKFEDRDLRDMVGKGAIGTGNFALHTKHVFQPNVAEFKARGEVDHQGRRALRYEYEVPWENSGYRIRTQPREEVVAFRGSFLVDAETLDLMRLEVYADEIPRELGVDRAITILEYAPMKIGALECLLPKSSELTLVSLEGAESRNRTELGGCRQYVAESKLSFDAPPAVEPLAPEKSSPPEPLKRLTMELSLDSDIALESAVMGDPIRAVLVHPLKNGERTLAPEGSLVLGNIVRLAKQGQPFDHYEIALEFHTLGANQTRYEYSATMMDASPASGLIPQTKRLNPTFTRQRKARMDILVREVQRGQGVLEWDAKHPRIPKGLRMRWMVDDLRAAPQ
jgi:hypothetical protein